MEHWSANVRASDGAASLLGQQSERATKARVQGGFGPGAGPDRELAHPGGERLIARHAHQAR